MADAFTLQSSRAGIGSRNGLLAWCGGSFQPICQAARTPCRRDRRFGPRFHRLQQAMVANGQGPHKASVAKPGYPNLAHRLTVLAPAKGFLDALTDQVPRMLRRASIDGRSAPARDAMRHWGRYAELATAGRELACAVRLIRRQRVSDYRASAPDYAKDRLALGKAVWRDRGTAATRLRNRLKILMQRLQRLNQRSANSPQRVRRRYLTLQQDIAEQAGLIYSRAVHAESSPLIFLGRTVPHA